MVGFALNLVVVAVEVADSIDVKLIDPGGIKESFEFDLRRNYGFDRDSHNTYIGRFSDLIDNLKELGVLYLSTKTAIDPLAAFV